MIKLKKAQTLADAYNVFVPTVDIITDVEDDFYVPVFEQNLKQLHLSLKVAQKSEIFFIAGQSGNGKTTAIKHLLGDDSISQKYDIHYFNREFFAQNDNIDVVDILLMIGFILADKSEGLYKKFATRLEELRDIHDGTLTKETLTSDKKTNLLEGKADIEVGVKFFSVIKSKANFITGFSKNNEIKEDARRFFHIKKPELVELVNDMIGMYKVNQNLTKELLIVIDDIEKAKYENIKSLFENDLSHILAINATKIMFMPVYIKRNINFEGLGIRTENFKEFSFKLKERQYKRAETYIDENIELLEEVVKKRAFDGLIQPNVIKQAVKYSGGNIRELIKIISTSVFEAMLVERADVTLYELDKAVYMNQQFYGHLILQHKVFLEKLQADTLDIEQNEETLAELMKKGIVFSYYNGFPWYSVYPILCDALKSAPSLAE
jgi:hypothetical protein